MPSDSSNDLLLGAVLTGAAALSVAVLTGQTSAKGIKKNVSGLVKRARKVSMGPMGAEQRPPTPMQKRQQTSKKRGSNQATTGTQIAGTFDVDPDPTVTKTRADTKIRSAIEQAKQGQRNRPPVIDTSDDDGGGRTVTERSMSTEEAFSNIEADETTFEAAKTAKPASETDKSRALQLQGVSDDLDFGGTL